MLMKSILNVPGDFIKTLKLRRLVSLGLLAVGAVGFLGYFLLVPGSGLPEFAQGFYLGASSGIEFGALLLLIRSQYLLTHERQRKKAQVKEQDEREVAIKNYAFQLAGFFMFFADAAALFIVLPFSRPAFWALLASMVLYALIFLFGIRYYEKKL